jgi:adenine-specific DNA-methyltransferase
MDKLKLHTPNLTDENTAKIAALFPHCVTEGKIDFELLKQELSSSLIDGSQERYQLNWVGKREALLNANAPIAKTLRPCRDESVAFDTTENLYIEGDNLDALKLLQETYLNKVKMIYIDPPYNTGNDFIYEDDFAENTADYLQRSNQKDEAGNRLTANPESNGRFHSDWLSMMYPRLKLARNLLRDDGVIFIQIDDNEQANLKRMCDEVFGEENFINLITVKTKVAGVSGSYLGNSLQNNTEQILFYARLKSQFSLLNLPAKRQELFDYIEIMRIGGKSWKYTQVLISKGEEIKITSFKDGSGDTVEVFQHKNPVIKSINSIAEEEFKGDLKKAYYKYINQIFDSTNAQSSIRQRLMDATNGIDSDLISIRYIPKSGKNKGGHTQLFYKGSQRRLFTWLKDTVFIEDGIIFKRDNKGNLWDDIQYNNLAKEGDIVFPNGKKPIQIIKDMQMMACGYSDIVLDFFSGSASTAHAVMQLNAEDGGKRRFIMVQIPESCDEKSDAFKAGYKTIADIGKERIRRAGQKIKADNALTALDLDIGFRVLKIDSSNMNDVYYSPDAISKDDLHTFIENIKPDRTDEDLLFQVLLDWGVDLSLPIECKTIDDKTVFVVANNAIVACFDRNGGVTETFIKELAKIKPLRAVFCDAGFASDSVKINVEQIFKMMSPSTDIKTI